MSDDLLSKLKTLAYQRSEITPFGTHLEFQQWADKVLPLLAFDQRAQREFKSLVTTIEVQHSLRIEKQENININNLFGILNQAIISLENRKLKALKSLEATEKITLQWVYKNASLNLYVWFFGLLIAALTSGFTLGIMYSSITATSQNRNLRTTNAAIPFKALPEVIETTTPKTPSQSK